MIHTKLIICSDLQVLESSMQNGINQSMFHKDLVIAKLTHRFWYNLMHSNIMEYRYILPHESEKLYGCNIFDVKKAGKRTKEANALFDKAMTLMRSQKDALCEPTSKSSISSLKKLASKILSWIRS